MKWYNFIRCNLFSQKYWLLGEKFWSFGIVASIIILIVVAIIAYGPWIPRTKTLLSLRDIPLKLPANFAEFPSKGNCTWAILSHGRFDVIWGEHTGLHDVAEWRVNFYTTQGLEPQLSIDPQYPDTYYPDTKKSISKKYKVTSYDYYMQMEEILKKDSATIDFGFLNPQLKGLKGVDIARLNVNGRKYIMCWVNDEIFVFMFYLY
jgi:hypothetical protein